MSELTDIFDLCDMSGPPRAPRPAQPSAEELLRSELSQVRRAMADLCEALSGKAARERARFVSPERAAQMLGRSDAWVRKALREGRLLGHKQGSTKQAQWLVDVTSIERLSG